MSARDISGSTLVELYQAHQGRLSDKWSSYLDFYEERFQRLRNQPIRLLEIGVQNGGSLEIWAKYFPDAEAIVGCDIDPNCGLLTFEDPRIKVFVGDAAAASTAELIAQHSAYFDIVIDDGSHRSGDIVRNFANYFPRLSDGGIYIMEDLHASYFDIYEGGLEAPYSSINFVKRLIDYVNSGHWLQFLEQDALLAYFANRYGISFNCSSLESIGELVLRDSIAAVTKQSAAKPRLGDRLHVGNVADVYPRSNLSTGLPQVNPHDLNFGPLSERAEFTIERRAAKDAEIQNLTSRLSISEEQGRQLGSAPTHAEERSRQLEGELDASRKQLKDTNRALETEVSRVVSLSSEGDRLKELLRSQSRIIQKKRLINFIPEWLRNRLEERALKKHFDSKYYLDANPDVAAAGVDPFGHFNEWGWREGRDPSADFSVSRYLFANPDIRELEENPFRYHYLNGRWEGRLATPTAQVPLLDYRMVQQSWNMQRKELELEIKALLELNRDGPLISVVVPVYKTEIGVLREMIDSVVRQTYRNWELLLVDDFSEQADLDKTLSEYAARDWRIRILKQEKNSGISGATNAGVGASNGTFVAFLDHDDTLDPDALLLIADSIRRCPKVKFLYTDEDKISLSGELCDPHFKPDWNQELLYSYNYICHLLVVRTDLLREVGSLRVGYEGAQDYDLVLRLSERADPSEILHIAKVLYHWRMSKSSTAMDAGAKPYAHQAGIRALEEHLIRKYGGTISVIDGPAPFSYRIMWPVDDEPLVSIIMPTRDQLKVLKTAVLSVLDHTTYRKFELIIVDNNSQDPEVISWMKSVQEQDDRVRVVRDEREFNYSALNNSAARMARGSILALLNNDIEIIQDDWLREMVSLATRAEVGCVGAKLLYPDRTVQHAGVIVGFGGVAGHIHLRFPEDSHGYMNRLQIRQEYTAVTGACLVLRKKIFEDVGGLNEENLAVAFNDVDLCLKVRRAGYVNVWTPYARLIHHESISRGYEDTPEKQMRFEKETAYMKTAWATERFADPAYNPNLSLDYQDFRYGRPVWEIRAI